MMELLHQMLCCVHVEYTCPKCGHAVRAEIDTTKPMLVGNQCPKCIEVYPPEFSTAVFAALTAFFAQKEKS